MRGIISQKVATLVTPIPPPGSTPPTAFTTMDDQNPTPSTSTPIHQTLGTPTISNPTPASSSNTATTSNSNPETISSAPGTLTNAVQSVASALGLNAPSGSGSGGSGSGSGASDQIFGINKKTWVAAALIVAAATTIYFARKK